MLQVQWAYQGSSLFIFLPKFFWICTDFPRFRVFYQESKQVAGIKSPSTFCCFTDNNNEALMAMH